MIQTLPDVLRFNDLAGMPAENSHRRFQRAVLKADPSTPG